MTSIALKQPTLRLIFSTLLALAAAFALTTGPASAATKVSDAPWSATGTGTTVASDGTSSDPVFSYAVNGQPLNAKGTWTFRATAKTERTQTIKWHYTGNHGRTGVRVKLELFVISNGHETPFNALPEVGPVNVPSGGFDYAGESRLRLRAGDVYGVRVSGANTDPEARLTGTVALTLPDATAPSVTPEITGMLGNDGWYTSDVKVHWNIQDAESDITSTSGCQDATVTTDTLGITYACTAVSAGGTTTQSVTIKRDTAPAPAPVPVACGAEHGTVKWFNDEKGYGFIARAEGDDVFVRSSSITGGSRTLTAGDLVCFDLEDGAKSQEAINVRTF